MSRRTSCRQRAFLLCVSSHEVSECLVAHPAGKGLFSCVYLLVMFQNVSWHIPQANGFSSVCIFAWCFKMSLHTSSKLRAFLLGVSTLNVSECFITYPAGKGLLTCVYLRMTFLVDPIDKDLVAYPTGKGLFSCVYLLMTFQNVSWHILQAKGFSPVCIF